MAMDKGIKGQAIAAILVYPMEIGNDITNNDNKDNNNIQNAIIWERTYHVFRKLNSR